ncbi:MAG: YraN family protein [Actinomycetaceae bacterium]|nr:YraN family protein [Actinomycetaceae bacterium]
MVTKSVGDAGETLACRFLVDKGMEILSRNWRSNEGEADIIALDKRAGQVVLCEVKTRSNPQCGAAIKAVGRRKMQRLRKIAASWQMENGWAPMRIDVIGIDVLQEDVTVTYLRGVS